MRYVIENTEAFRILAERARTREVAHAAALAAGQLSRVAASPTRWQRALAILTAVVVVGLGLRAVLPVGLRVEVAAGLVLLGILAVPALLLAEIVIGHQPASRHSQP